ncbi:MAG: ABC transporter ATP-binding protein, partial [Deltaproteobacteria bacterium]
CASEVLQTHAQLGGLSRQQAHRRSRKLLAQLGLLAAAERRLATFSKGMLQRLALCQALIASPDLLVLDEPMSGLDPQARHSVREALLAHARLGKTVFFSTHILPDVEMICHRVAIIAAGRLRHVGDVGALSAGKVELWADHVSPELQQSLTRPGMLSRAEARGTVFVCDNVEQANMALDLLRQGGATIRSLQTTRSSLETTFLRATGSQMVL